jgi:membrane protease YdiL (CAAX protease family)
MEKKTIKGLFVFISYFIYSYLAMIPFYLLSDNVDAVSPGSKALYLFATNTVFLCCVLMVYQKDIVKYYHDFKKHGNEYLHKTINYWYLGLGIMMITNAIINRLNPNGMPENEETVRNFLNEVPLYTVFSAAIYAPIVEEIICRKVFKDIINNKWLFVIISG